MTKGINVLILIAFASICGAIAQDSLTPPPSPTTKESASPSPTPEQTPSASPASSVSISFVPPLLEGTITLGTYYGNRRPERLLHQEAALKESLAGAEELVK